MIRATKPAAAFRSPQSHPNAASNDNQTRVSAVFIRYPELRPKKGVTYTRNHIGRLERQDKFPKHVELGGNSIAWIEEEIDAWIAHRITERDLPKSDRTITVVAKQSPPPRKRKPKVLGEGGADAKIGATP